MWSALGLTVFGLLMAIIGYSYFSKDLPSTMSLHRYEPPVITYFYSDDGRIIGEFYHERRFVVPISDIPPMVRNAFIAVEDAAFYSHPGINPKGILRAAISNFSGGPIQGGSTITQQVIKTFLLSPKRSYVRKIKEMILALRLEKHMEKDEILYLYLNHIYLGRGSYGIESAARSYFDKSAANLTIAEAAMLAGITQNPGRNPVSNSKVARARQFWGIHRMLTVGFITEDEAKAAQSEVLNIKGGWPSPNTEVTPYFTEHVRRMMEEQYGAESLYNDGWRVFTTVNIEAQQDADVAVARGLWEYGRRRGYKGPIQELEEHQIKPFITKATESLDNEIIGENQIYEAVVLEVNAPKSTLTVQVGPYPGIIPKKNLSWALKKRKINKLFKRGDVISIRLAEQTEQELDPEDLSVDSLVDLIASDAPEIQTMFLEQRTDTQAALLSMESATGDIKAMVGGRDFGESQFNRAVQSQRQPGSSFKPILYTSALENGFTPGSVMNDAPFVVDNPGSGKRWKPVNSDRKFNGPMTLYRALATSRNLISVKLLDRIGYEALAKTAAAMGITETLPQSLTVSLGAHGLHMPELLTAYSVFPNMGNRVAPRYITRIEDRYGNVIATFEPKQTPAVDPGIACAMTWMLRAVVEEGTGRAMKKLGRPVGGKTGTTNDYSDAWFVGFTPDLLTAVWVGNDNQGKAIGEVGGKAAGPIFLYYMENVLEGVPITNFIPPPEAELVPGGAIGTCYKAGTVGTGLSETVVTTGTKDEFLRDDFGDVETYPASEDGQTQPESQENEKKSGDFIGGLFGF